MEYLQREYVANNSVTYTSETNYQTLRRAAELILQVIIAQGVRYCCISLESEALPYTVFPFMQWWWRSRYGQLEQFDMNNASAYFGRYLLRQYQDSCRVNTDDNIVPGPR